MNKWLRERKAHTPAFLKNKEKIDNSRKQKEKGIKQESDKKEQNKYESVSQNMSLGVFQMDEVSQILQLVSEKSGNSQSTRRDYLHAYSLFE